MSNFITELNQKIGGVLLDISQARDSFGTGTSQRAATLSKKYDAAIKDGYIPDATTIEDIAGLLDTVERVLKSSPSLFASGLRANPNIANVDLRILSGKLRSLASSSTTRAFANQIGLKMHASSADHLDEEAATAHKKRVMQSLHDAYAAIAKLPRETAPTEAQVWDFQDAGQVYLQTFYGSSVSRDDVAAALFDRYEEGQPRLVLDFAAYNVKGYISGLYASHIVAQVVSRVSELENITKASEVLEDELRRFERAVAQKQKGQLSNISAQTLDLFDAFYRVYVAKGNIPGRRAFLDKLLYGSAEPMLFELSGVPMPKLVLGYFTVELSVATDGGQPDAEHPVLKNENRLVKAGSAQAESLNRSWTLFHQTPIDQTSNRARRRSEFFQELFRASGYHGSLSQFMDRAKYNPTYYNHLVDTLIATKVLDPRPETFGAKPAGAAAAPVSLSHSDVPLLKNPAASIPTAIRIWESEAAPTFGQYKDMLQELSGKMGGIPISKIADAMAEAGGGVYAGEFQKWGLSSEMLEVRRLSAEIFNERMPSTRIAQDKLEEQKRQDTIKKGRK